MISKEHNLPAGKQGKHDALARPALGNYHRNEWAIIGGPCVKIKAMADQVITALSDKYKCAYADTTHNDDLNSVYGRLAKGATIEYTDQINYQQLNYKAVFNPFKLKHAFAEVDFVLVNGNHQQAKSQIVIIDTNKKTSLHKRLDQLTNVEMIILADNADDVFDFVKEKLPNWSDLPLYRFDEAEKIIGFFEKQMQLAKPVLNGLVLAGGKSQRMGFDKGTFNWHGKEQRYYVADMMETLCKEIFISCREDQKHQINKQYEAITDTFTGLGPCGAILSAFREKPDCAWLVVACDLPLLDQNTLQYLAAHRNTSSVATSFKSATDGFPEPLITIWEPKSYPLLLSFLAQGYSCPRKVLINSDTTILKAPDKKALTNVNTPDELEEAIQIRNKKMTAQ